MPPGTKVVMTLEVNDDETVTCNIAVSHTDLVEPIKDTTIVMPVSVLAVIGAMIPPVPEDVSKSMTVIPNDVPEL